MSKVNFVAEFNALMRYARDKDLPMRERMLWIALFYIANDRAVYNEQTHDYDWPDDFMLVSNGELNMYTNLDKRAIETLRNQLMQRGLIEFVPGKKNKRNPAYKIHYLSVNVGYKIVPNTPPNYVPNDAPNNDPNDDPNTATNPSPFSKYNKDSGIEGNKDVLPEEEEDTDNDLRTYARVRGVIQGEYQAAFRQPPTEPELEDMTRSIVLLNLVEVADRAVEATAKAAPKNRLAYFKQVCIDWSNQYIRTREDLSEYLWMQSMGAEMMDQNEYYAEKIRQWQARRDKYKPKEEPV